MNGTINAENILLNNMEVTRGQQSSLKSSRATETMNRKNMVDRFDYIQIYMTTLHVYCVSLYYLTHSE